MTHTAPVKVTGGGGFLFEDKVGAYFAAAVLASAPPLDPEAGPPERIDFQVGADGWLLDDLLLTFERGGDRLRCAISVKSGQQFSTDKAPADFVRRTWRQFLQESADCFDRERDLIGLIAPPLPTELQGDWYEISRLAREQDTALLAVRLRSPGVASDRRRTLFASFTCPPDLALRYGVDERRTGELISRLRILAFDFEFLPSSRLEQALEWCRRSLVRDTLENAQGLWEALLAVVAEVRTAGGYLDRPRLIERLRDRFDLLHETAYRRDWAALERITEQNLAFIPDKLGGRLHLARLGETDQLAQALNTHQFVAVLGPSGCGKTAMAKRWVTEVRTIAPVVWLRAQDLEATAPGDFQSLGLEHPLTEVLRGFPKPLGYLVVDGLDRMFGDQATRNVATLVQLLQSQGEASPWRLLVTCQTGEWARNVERLAGLNVAPTGWHYVSLGHLSDGDLREVIAEFPQVREIVLHAGLRSVLRNPKVLDLAVRHVVGAAEEPPEHVGEVEVAARFWDREVLGPEAVYARAEFLKRLAERQADRLELETPLSELDDTTLLHDLERDGLCAVARERVAFAHDLYGDWARHRVLVGQAKDLCEYLGPRIASPLWHRAIRLYAVDFLSREDGLAAWKEAVERLGGDQTSLPHDLFLEAALFAGDPEAALERLWPELVLNQGELLRRLLRRFLYVATVPNPIVLQIAVSISPELRAQAATLNRLPLWPLWLPVLRFLTRHQPEALELAPHELAQIADCWLRLGLAGWPLRREAAEIGLAVGERMYALKEGRTLVQGEVGTIAFRAALAATLELPERAADLALRLARRRGPIVQRVLRRSIEGEEDIEIPPPWPDGPHWRVDDTFQRACLTSDAMQPFIAMLPQVAREVILALLIEPPRPREPFHPYRGLRERLEIEHVSGWFPPLYTRGPFSLLLTQSRIDGIELVVRLVNFATDRWAEEYRLRNGVVPSVVLELDDGPKTWTGNAGVFSWYRGDAHAPFAVTSALMALEKWLYDQQDQNRDDLNNAFNHILAKSRSVAFAGLLAAVACRRPGLLTGALRPVVRVPEFLLWDREYKVRPHDYLMIGWRREDVLSKLAQDWHNLEHRRFEVLSWALMFLLNDDAMRSYFADRRNEWIRRLASLEPGEPLGGSLRRLIAWFNQANYRTEHHPEYGEYWAFREPDDLRAEREEAQAASAEALRFLDLPMQCRRILDGEADVPDDQLEKFWGTLREIEQRPIPPTLRPGTVVREDVLCGGAAVLLKRHRDWLKEHPDREQWCIETLIKTVEHPPPQAELDSEMSIVTWGWDGFCAETLPAVWAERRYVPRIRQAVARLATSNHYKTIEILFRGCAVRRQTLGEDFERLQHLGFRWARHVFTFRRIGWGAPLMPQGETLGAKLAPLVVRAPGIRRVIAAWMGSKATTRRVQRAVRRDLRRFTRGTLPARLPRWGELAVPDAPVRIDDHGIRRRRHERLAEMDLEYIQAAFAWLPPLASAQGPEERRAWIAFWQEALSCLLRRLGADAEGDYEVEGTPYDWDRWVLSGVVHAIIAMTATEGRRRLWEPVLGLGNVAHRWVESFFEAWFRIGLAKSPVAPAFMEEWKAMWDYVNGASRWQAMGRVGFNLEELEYSLAGLGPFAETRWLAEYAPTVSEMRPFYRRWADRRLASHRSARQFIQFLHTPAARPLLHDGLVWLHESVDRRGKVWTDRGTIEDLASLLEFCWRKDESAFREQTPAAMAFRELLRKLADLQLPLALELLDRLSARQRG